MAPTGFLHSHLLFNGQVGYCCQYSVFGAVVRVSQTAQQLHLHQAYKYICIYISEYVRVIRCTSNCLNRPNHCSKWRKHAKLVRRPLINAVASKHLGEGAYITPRTGANTHTYANWYSKLNKISPSLPNCIAWTRALPVTNPECSAELHRFSHAPFSGMPTCQGRRIMRIHIRYFVPRVCRTSYSAYLCLAHFSCFVWFLVEPNCR